MAGAKLTPSPSEIDPDVKTEVQKTPPEPTWVNPSMAARTMGSFGSDTGQRYGRRSTLHGEMHASRCSRSANLQPDYISEHASHSSRAADLQQQQQQPRSRNVRGVAAHACGAKVSTTTLLMDHPRLPGF